MIIAVPGVPPITTPVVRPIEAVPGALLLHVPPAVASLRVIEEPEQTLGNPAIGAGLGYTVTATVSSQPVGNV